MAHTKGPWEICGTLGKIAITKKHDSIGIAPHAICHIWPHVETGKPEANAALIAAAPDLLAACRELLIYIKADSETKALMYPQSIEFAKDAIKKAKRC